MRSEASRLDILSSYGLMHSESEHAYDAITQFAADLFQTPVSAISLIGAERVWFKSVAGLQMSDIERDGSLCVHTLHRVAPLVIHDASTDDRFANSPMVACEGGVRFYAGAPLLSLTGHCLGALCIADPQPRSSFGEREQKQLSDLAQLVMTKMEDHRAATLSRSVLGFAKNIDSALITSDSDGKIIYWNASAERLFGHKALDVIGCKLEIIIPKRFRAEHSAGLQRTARSGHSKLSGKTVELCALHKDNSEFPIELRLASWMGSDGIEIGAQIQDISERRARETRLEKLAHHDPLTGLFNRTGFDRELKERLEYGRAVLMAIDLDRFKEVNDVFGHTTGDAILEAAAFRFLSLGESGCVVARVGGDEFAILLPQGDDLQSATVLANHLKEAFNEPFIMLGHRIQLGLSIGIAAAPHHADNADDLLARADSALLEAKKTKGNSARTFDTAIAYKMTARRAFKDDLRKASQRKEWRLLYQPQVRLADQKIIGVEALLRWEHPQRGLLEPRDFLETLETHLVAEEVGGWILDEACSQLTRWRDSGIAVPRMALNLFPIQFEKGNLDKKISAALEQYALHPSDIEIEITERIALRSGDQIQSELKRLRDCGVHIALDDFGTGFASLSTLARLPVSRLKIDRSFVRDVNEKPEAQAIVQAIISLGRSLQLEVIAEGIETDEQRIKLMYLGCNEGQGYLMGKPKCGDDKMWFDHHSRSSTPKQIGTAASI